jgi:Predicted periplasmic or secreted lipoprotein
MASKGKIRDMIKLLDKDGWVLIYQKGSHRQFKHPIKTGKVTVNGKPGDDIYIDNWFSMLKQAGLK